MAVAGDSFDYALNADGLHVAILDSVGHDLGSSLISHLVPGALRNSPRRGLNLPAAYSVADEAIGDLYPDQRFVTAAFGHVDSGSGPFRWISARPSGAWWCGARRARGADRRYDADRAAPYARTQRQRGRARPGDAVVLYTDG